MRYLLVFVAIVAFCVGTLTAQENQGAKRSIEIIPRSSILPVIVSQPECPLQIEKVILVKHLDMNDHIEMLYQVRNNGDKAIVDYTIIKWFSDNTGFIGGGEMSKADVEFKPGEIAGPLVGKSALNLATSAGAPEKDQGATTMKRIAFIGIVEIEFSDGSKYRAREDFDALEEHLKLFELPYEKFDETLRKAKKNK